MRIGAFTDGSGPVANTAQKREFKTSQPSGLGAIDRNLSINFRFVSFSSHVIVHIARNKVSTISWVVGEEPRSSLNSKEQGSNGICESSRSVAVSAFQRRRNS